MLTLKTIDAHAEGGPVRLIVGGFPAPRGPTMHEKVEWMTRHADRLRRSLMLEPRGHADMCGAVLTEPVSPGSHAGLIFMTGDGYSPMSGHGIIAVTTIALERGLVVAGGDGVTVSYDTPAGTVRARAHPGAGGAARSGETMRVERVSFVNVPSFVLHGGVVVKAAGRRVRVDVAFGGVFHAIVDSEALGLAIDPAHVPELRRAGMEVRRAAGAAHPVVHPLDRRLQGLFGTIFTGPPRTERADLRTVTVFADAQVDRSPGGTGTAAIMSVLDAMGLIAEDRPFVHEGLIDTRLTGRVVNRTSVGGYDAIVAEIEGSAWITGEHTFLIDDDDPLSEGFRL
jgi:proline racemase